MEKRKNKNIQIAVLVISLIIFCAGIVWLVMYFSSSPDDTSKYKQSEESAVSEVSDVSYAENPVDFNGLSKKNSDIYAWITVPGTKVDYPVVCPYSEDDNFYMDHNLEKKYDVFGAVFSQKLNSTKFDDPNTVIYGHNMKDGSMFASLHNFMDKNFFKKHEFFYIYQPGRKLTYRIFSAHESDNRHILNSFDFLDKKVFSEYISSSLHPDSLSANVRDTKITTDDRLVTLSTCIGNYYARYLVQGVLIKDEPTR